jgi:hypothetical protein
VWRLEAGTNEEKSDTEYISNIEPKELADSFEK